MTSVILHIGMHKTGSTAIQQALNGYNDGQFAYADLGYENHSIPIYTAFSSHYQRYHIWKSSGLDPAEIEQRRDTARTRLQHALASPVASTLVISGEDISLLQRKEVEDLAQFLSAYRCDVKVLAYFREPVSFSNSVFQEVVKLGFPAQSLEPPRYQYRFGKFLRVFGREAVTFREFDRNKLTGGDVVADFCHRIGLPVGRLANRQANTSLSLAATKSLYLLDAHGVLTTGDATLNKARQRLAAVLTTLTPGAFKLPPDIISKVFDGPDIAWMEQNGKTRFDLDGGDRSLRAAGGYEDLLKDFMLALPDNLNGKISDYLVQHGVPTAQYSTSVDLLTRLFYQMLEDCQIVEPKD